MKDHVRETTEDAEHSSRSCGVVILAVGFVVTACLIAAAVIMSAKGIW